MGKGRARRLALVAGLCAWLPNEAHAEKTYSVLITSEPAGATIYFDVGDEGMIETTPYRGKLPAGKYSVVFELEGYNDKIAEFRVRKRSRRQRLKVRLEEFVPAYLRVEIRPPDLEGVVIRINDEPREVGEDRFELPPGTHCVEVVQKELGPFTKCLELEPGQKKKLVAILTKPENRPQPECPDPDNPLCDAECPDPDNPLCEEGPDPEPDGPLEGYRPPLFLVSAGLHLGGRRFRFKNPTGSLRPFTAGGLLAVGGSVELNPLADSQDRRLRHLGVVARGVYAFPFESTAPTAAQGDIPTKWREFDGALRLAYPVGEASAAGVEAGFGIQQFKFDDGVGGALEGVDAEVAGVDYRYIRGSVYGETALWGSVRGFASAGYRHLIRVGDLKRLGGASGRGASLLIGASTRFANYLDVRLLGNFEFYSLSFGGGVNALGQSARGGTDLFFGLRLAAGLAR